MNCENLVRLHLLYSDNERTRVSDVPEKALLRIRARAENRILR